ncbi:MAG TPA: hypothetical protein VLT62_03010 [Candidatus Methylomirabilis sp.]|nr:hypothetical protein [Candidatus Methylomirabilis sp.]
MTSNAIATSKSDDGAKTGIGLAFALNIAPITTWATVCYECSSRIRRH